MRCRIKFWSICRRLSNTAKLFKPPRSFIRILFKMWKGEWSIQKFKLNHDNPEDFTRSFWQSKEKVLPIWIAYRMILFVYFVTTFAYMLIRDNKDDFNKLFIFATTWSYTVESFAYVLSFIIVVERYIKEKRNSELGNMKKMPWHYQCYWAFFTIAASTALVITFVFWLFLYEPDGFPNPVRALIIHALNSLIIFFDFLLCGHPIRFLHFYLPVVFSTAYGIFSAIYQYAGGTGTHGKIPIYKILDWRTPDRAVETCVGCIIAVVISHCLLALLHLLKIWLKKPSDIL